ncbi:uncharacterized protein LOC144716548 [Wolffia australiana]
MPETEIRKGAVVSVVIFIIKIAFRLLTFIGTVSEGNIHLHLYTFVSAVSEQNIIQTKGGEALSTRIAGSEHHMFQNGRIEMSPAFMETDWEADMFQSAGRGGAGLLYGRRVYGPRWEDNISQNGKIE